MAFRLFGFQFGKNDSQKKEKVSFVVADENDGSTTIETGIGGGTNVAILDIAQRFKDELTLITKYREMALHADVDSGIDDIVNEAIVNDEQNLPVSIVLDQIDEKKVPDKIKDLIREEFDYIIRLLDFSSQAYEIFRQWYVDGRLFYHAVIDPQNPKKGIQELRLIDPRQILKIKEVRRDVVENTDIPIITKVEEYYIYNQEGIMASRNGQKISPDSVVHCHSGIFDQVSKMVLSPLHKAIKPLNRLTMVEDAIVIYRWSRAPERRVFFVDVGSMPKHRSEQYVNKLMNKFKNNVVYNQSTGEIQEDRQFMSILEDFWIPRREGSQATDITQLGGAQNLGDLEDLEHFQRKLYKALGVPISRMEAQSGFSFGRTSEITRDEIKFGKKIGRLRKRFSHLFNESLKKQLLLKKILDEETWEEIKSEIQYDFVSDVFFNEMKQVEITRERLSVMRDIEEYVGKYFSKNWIRKNILMQSEEQIEEINNEIEEEEKDKDINTEEDGGIKGDF